MKYLVYVLFLFIMSIIGCSVAPALESPRIKSGVKLEAGFSNMRNEMKWHLSDTIMCGGIYSDELKFKYGSGPVEFAPKMIFAFLDKVEFGGYLWWFMLNKGWDGRIKINVLDVGEGVIFRNIGMALLAGAKGARGERDESGRNWAGITLGTLHTTDNFEIEYIIMPTIGINHVKSLDDRIGTIGITFDDLMIHTGISIFSSEQLYASFAILLSLHAFNFQYDSRGYFGQITRIDEIKLTPQKIGFNFNLGCRFRIGRFAA